MDTNDGAGNGCGEEEKENSAKTPRPDESINKQMRRPSEISYSLYIPLRIGSESVCLWADSRFISFYFCFNTLPIWFTWKIRVDGVCTLSSRSGNLRSSTEKCT